MHKPTVPNSMTLRRPALAVFGLALSLCCTSCADLTEVAKFAASAKTACAGYAAIINDFAGSATRRAQYVRDTQKAQAASDVEKYKDLQPAMLAAQKPLTDYIAALAAISTDGAADKSDSPDKKSGSADQSSASAPSASSLQKAGMPSTEAAAALGLATKVTALLTAGYRSEKAGKAIRDCNPDLQDYLKGLEQIVGTDYPLRLDAEKNAVEGYYTDLLQDHGAAEPLAAITTRKQQDQDLAAIEARRQAAAAYVKILIDIGEGHQKLADAAQNLTAKQLVSIVEPYAADIESQSVAVKRAF